MTMNIPKCLPTTKLAVCNLHIHVAVNFIGIQIKVSKNADDKTAI
jgi:hypothetical protein